ncbi:MAG: PAS domain S-box protein [Candidatus Thorarchaeota archaeon]
MNDTQIDELVRLAMMNAPYLVLILDRERKVVYANPAVSSTLGYSLDRVLGAEFGSFLRPRSKEKFEEVVEDVESTEGLQLVSLSALKRDGSVCDLDGNVFVVRDEQGNAWVCCCFYDVTKARRTMRMIEDREKKTSELLQTVTHDLTSIHQEMTSAFEVLLGEGGLEDDLSSMIQDALSEVRRGSRLVSAAAKLVRIDREAFETRRMDPAKCFSNALESVRPKYPERQIVVEGEFPSGYVVYANEFLCDAFSTLIGLMVELDESKSVLVSVNVTEDTSASMLEIAVEGHGRGLKDEEKESVFDDYENPVNRVMGLSMTLVKRIVGALGGDIRVEDRIMGNHRQGVRFVVRLPYVESP